MGLGMAGAALAAGADSVRFERGENVLRVSIGGQPFTEYHFNNGPFPYLDPLIGPTGTNLLRNFPMRDVEGETHDHPHHRGLWFTHGDVNGHDFWSSKHGEKIVHEDFVEIDSKAGCFTTTNQWRSGGETICADTRTLAFRAVPDGVEIDFTVTIHASNGDAVFGDTKEGAMAIRLAAGLQVDKPGAGRIVNSDGLTDKDAWGKRALWCDDSGPLGGGTVGVAILDHPSNPRHPTGWHARTYGLFAANPFAIKSFKFSDTEAPFVIPAGKSATFRYRFLFHKGDAKAAGIDRRFQAWAVP